MIEVPPPGVPSEREMFQSLLDELKALNATMTLVLAELRKVK